VEIVNAVNESIFFGGNGVTAKLLGSVIYDGRAYVYYFAEGEEFIEERVHQKYSDSIVKSDELEWIESEHLWNTLLQIGDEHKILGQYSGLK